MIVKGNPRLAFIVGSHRVGDLQQRDEISQAIDVFLGISGRGMHADDGQPDFLKFSVPFPQRGNCPQALLSSITPELHQHHPPAQISQGHGISIDPGQS